MEINEISPEKLKSDNHQQTIWLKGEDGDLFIILEKQTICHFEVTFDEKHLEGGHAKPLKYGLVDGQHGYDNLDDVLKSKKSRIVKYQNDIPKDFVDQAISLIHKCQNLEKAIAEGLMKYLSSLGRDDTGLTSTVDYSSFREIIPQNRDYKNLLWSHRNKIILSLFLLLVIKLSYNLFWRGDLRDACKKGSDLACANLGMINLVQGSKNPNALWIKASIQKQKSRQEKCNAGDMDSCYQLYDDKTLKYKQSRNITLNELACLRHNHARGCYYFGKENLYDEKREEGIENLKVACRQNYRDSCDILATEKSFTENLKKCNNRDFQACYYVGMQFRKNAKQKLATAKLNLACDHKIIPACMEMGTFHAEKGEFIEAKKNFKIACDLDHLKGCYHFKYLIIRGSEKKALQLIYEKCLEHDETACIELKKFP